MIFAIYRDYRADFIDAIIGDALFGHYVIFIAFT